MNVALNACHFATCCRPVPVPLVKILYACGFKPRPDKREFRSFLSFRCEFLQGSMRPLCGCENWFAFRKLFGFFD
jgi:hypothetical protein